MTVNKPSTLNHVPLKTGLCCYTRQTPSDSCLIKVRVELKSNITKL